MKATITAVLMGLAVVLLIGGIFGFARTSQSDLDQATQEADLHTAKAMRYLQNYQANLDAIALYQNRIGRALGSAEAPVSVPPKDEKVNEIVRSALEDFQALSKELQSRSRSGTTDRLDARVRQLVPDASALPEPPRPGLGQNESTITRSVSNAIKQLERLTKENPKILKQALQEADAALRVQHGQVSMQDHVNANHVKATVLYIQGQMKRAEARSARIEEHDSRLRATQLIERSQNLLRQINETKGRIPAQKLAQLEKDKKLLQGMREGAKAKLAELTAQAQTIRDAIAAAQAEAEKSRTALLDLEKKGFDPKSPKDVRRYTEAYAALAAQGRNARLAAAALESGTLEGARLDDARGGDLILDKYVPAEGEQGIRVVKGLNTLEHEHAAAKKRLAEIEGLLSENAKQTEEVRQTAKALEQHASELAEMKSKVDAEVKAVLAECGKRAERASKAEDDATSILQKAGKAFGRAARAARNRGGELVQKPTMSGLRDRDTEQTMTIGQGDAAHALALTRLQRLRASQHQLELVQAMLDAKVPGVEASQAEALSKEVAQARKESLEAVEESIELLQRPAQRMDRKYIWIPQASLAAAYQLKGLLAETTAATEALVQAVEQYEEAVKEREGSPFLQPYVRMLPRVRELAERAQALHPTTAATQPAAETQPGGAASPSPAKQTPPGSAKKPARPARSRR